MRHNMNKIIKVILFTFSVLLIEGCAKEANNKIVVENCDNVFVVSDESEIYLFEHEVEGVDFHLLGKYQNKSNTGAFFDCKRNIIVSPYGYKGVNNNKGGVTIFNLNNGKLKDYIIPDGVNGQLGVYNNGVLLSTMLMHSTKIDKKSGYVPPNEIIKKESVLENPKMFPREVVEQYNSGELWKSFEYIHLFDLDTKTVTKSYSQNIDYGHIYNNKLYSEFIDAVGAIDLKNGFVEKIIERRVTKHKNEEQLSLPAISSGVFVNENYYVITTGRSWDTTRRKMLNFEKNTIYKVVNESLVKLTSLPFKTFAYAFSINENIYIFSNTSEKVFEFNTQTKKNTLYDLKLPDSVKGYVIDSVGYTNKNFILTLSVPGYTKGAIFLLSNDFSKISQKYDAPMGAMSVTTVNNIQTLNKRSL